MRENSEIENRLASLVGEDEPPKSKMKSSTAQSKSVNKSRTAVTTTKVYVSVILIVLLRSAVKFIMETKGMHMLVPLEKSKFVVLRTEASQAPKSKQTLVIPQGSMVTSHLQILAGKGGSKGSWSIEKPKSTIDENSPGLTYAILKRYVLSKEDMIENGYPVMNSEIKGKAYITQNPQYSNRKPQPQEPDKTLYRQRSNRALGPTSGYYCCNGDTNSEGCEVSQVHITDMEDYNNMRDVQAVLLSMFSSDTILIGHSLESDLKALKMVHSMVVDTSIVFPHKMGPPYKRALKHLAAEHLKRIIQNDVGGHDSAEDALAALDLMKVKVKSDVKKLQQDSLKQR
ncbi:REX1 [Lepeophtheirus salmonis]|uniref:REX1 n=1 Tax=Lepeophtheirus salmonis TaxID=72036 RepID=A0A7R8H2V5_LEPSM|nr:REX1 [Lepeophtheirus salmonis]CAF2833058.1 REX1 [Lepeophtheirus salmonis]